MTLNDYLLVAAGALIRQRLPSVVGGVVLGLGAALLIVAPRDRRLQRHDSMYVSAQTADTTSTAYQGAQLSQHRVKSYVELVTSPRVSQEVIATCGWPSCRTTWRNGVTAASSIDSVLIDVTVTDRSPEQAARIAERRRAEPVPVSVERARAAGVGRRAAAGCGARWSSRRTPRSSRRRRAFRCLLALGLVAGLAIARRRGADAQLGGHLHQGSGAARHLTRAPNLGGHRVRPVTRRNGRSPCTRTSRLTDAPRRSGICAPTCSSSTSTTRPRSSSSPVRCPTRASRRRLANLAIALASAGGRVLVDRGRPPPAAARRPARPRAGPWA